MSQPLWGYLLIGGQGRRLGGRKASQRVGGVSLGHRGWELLAEVCTSRWLLGGCEDWPIPGCSQIYEAESGQGPLAAICAGLAHCRSDWAFFLAVDYPLLEVAQIEQLCVRLKDTRSQVVAARVDGQRHPLIGIYSAVLLEQLQRRFQEGERSLLKALECAAVEWVDFAESGHFLNVNRPSDLSQARSRCSSWLPTENPPG